MSDATRCPRCGQDNPLRAKYCAQCGLHLMSAGAGPAGRAASDTQRGLRGWLMVGVILAGIVLGTVFLTTSRARHQQDTDHPGDAGAYNRPAEVQVERHTLTIEKHSPAEHARE